MRRVVICLFVLGGCLLPIAGLAQSQPAVSEPGPIQFIPEVPLPNFVGGPITSTTFYEYLRSVFVLFMWMVGVLATVMVVYGGIKWVAAAGNPARINDARETINNAIIGVIIALTSVVLLNIISPQFTQFQGLTVRAVDPQLLSFERAVVTSVPSVPECTVNVVAGPPAEACYDAAAPKCTAGLNDWVNRAARQYEVDPFLIKGLIAKESLLKGKPTSRATTVLNRDGKRSTTAYGIGQFVVRTMTSLLQEVNGRLPAECPDRGNIDPATNTLIASCRQWLDTHLEVQVKMVTLYLKQIGNSRCVNNDPRLVALGYYLGPGSAIKYCTGESILLGKTEAERAQRLQQGKDYVNGVLKFYQQYCDASK